MVSHELRTPLTVMKVSTELLDHFNDSTSIEQRQQYLERMQDAVNQMNRLMDEILLLGQAESGEIAFSPIALNPTDFCRDLVDELRIGVAQDRVISFHSQGECAEAQLDVSLLRSVLTNLLTNAIKYSPANSIIAFNLECRSDCMIFEIKDKGRGIPVADQSRLFEAFHRAQNVG